jgi:cystathionine beta-lyase/cystathionine gamma-synthase
MNALESAIAALEGTATALCCRSGMAAIVTMKRFIAQRVLRLVQYFSGGHFGEARL